jgi:hypothetical protein
MHARPVLSLAALVALAVTALPIAAQDRDRDFDDDDWLADCRDESSYRRGRRFKHCELRESGMRPVGGALRVDPGRNGGVAVRAWDRDSVHVVAKIQVQGGSAQSAEELAREVRIVTRGGTIHAEGPSGLARDEWWSVSFEVYTPLRTDLDLATENGPLSVRGVHGRMQLSARNGPVALRGVAGDVRARVQNGPLSVFLDGARWVGTGLDAETVNGPAVLAIPEGYSADLETGTVNGPMSLEFPLTVTVQGRFSTRRLNTKLGDGGPPVRVVTTNGPLVIRRRGGA